MSKKEDVEQEQAGKEKAERLVVEPLLPLEGDRRLAREAEVLAAKHYPAAWIRRSNAGRKLRATTYFPVEGAAAFLLGAVTLVIFGYGVAASLAASVVFGVAASYLLHANGFGYYGGWTGVLAVGKLDGKERDANVVHELGHRMQEVVPGVVEYERQFLAGKLGRIPKKWGLKEFSARFLWAAVAGVLWVVTLGRAELQKEWRAENARGVYHEYVMKERPNGRSFEVLSMGTQGLWFGAMSPKTGEFDQELRPYEDHRELIERMFDELG